uniref:GCR073 n=1 Tax=Schmidtea mediterranea TaxID=79327 RepID=A0A193KUK2_SCHMD|nr:GCR073 [Schmidtea mediterranea]
MYNSSNNLTLPKIPSFNGYNLFKSVFFLVVFFISILGNTHTIFFTLKLQKRSKLSYRSLYRMIMQLAFADILVCLFFVLTQAIWNIFVSWRGGSFLCKLMKMGQAFSIYLSTYIMSLVSLDRAIAICKPIHHLHSWNRNIKIIIICLWIYSFLLAIPQVLLFDAYRGPWKTVTFYQCTTSDNLNILQMYVYPLVYCVLILLIPIGILVTCYTVIIHTINVRSKEYEEHNSVTILFHQPKSDDCEHLTNQFPFYDDAKHSGSNNDNETIVINRISENSNNFQKLLSHKKQQLMSRAKIKTYRMSAIIISCFLLCWLPYWVYYVLITLKNARLIKFTLGKNIWISVFIQSLASLNSAFNPIIYGFFNRNFFLFFMRKNFGGQKNRRKMQFQ